jgi:uncharacterized membrane protein YciS (DUF1049 family)
LVLVSQFYNLTEWHLSVPLAMLIVTISCVGGWICAFFVGALRTIRRSVEEQAKEVEKQAKEEEKERQR